MALRYAKDTASAQDICAHLTQCDSEFVSPLSERVDIEAYSEKLFTRAITFEAWSESTLAGLVAAYFNDPDGKAGYISSVSTLKAHRGKGIAATLMRSCIAYAEELSFQNISLEVEKDNQAAVNMYEAFRFQVCEKRHSVLVMRLDL